MLYDYGVQKGASHVANVTLEFAVLSDFIKKAFDVEEDGQNDTDLFWDRFSDSCPVSYGDASYTLVKSSIVLDTIEEVKSRIQPTDFFDEFEEEPGGIGIEDAEARADAFERRCNEALKLIHAGPEYVDLEG